MTIENVFKVVALEGERKTVESSYKEMERFIEGYRPDFKDRNVLCVKFLTSETDSIEGAEETKWYINPDYIPDYSQIECMDSDFLPEIILIHRFPDERCIFQEYEDFNKYLMKKDLNNLTDQEKFELFVEFIRNPEMKSDFSN